MVNGMHLDGSELLEDSRLWDIFSHEELLRTIFENFHEGLAVIDLNFNILKVNRWMRDFYGKNIIGRKCYEVFHGKTEPCPTCPAKEVIEKLIPKHVLFYIKEKSVWFEIYLYPIKDESDHAVGILEHARDVTERVEAEKKLGESEEKFRSIINDVMNAVDVGFFILDKNFRVVWVNDKMEKYLGIKREEVIGRDKRQLVYEKIKNVFENPEKFAKEIISSYPNSSKTKVLECHVLPDGQREERWLEYKSKPITSGFYAGGRIELYYDITECKRLECKLKENIEIFKSIAEHAKDAIIMIDNEGKVVFWNRSAEQMFGYKVDEVIGKDIHMICAPGRYLDDYRKGFRLFKEQGKGKIIGKTVEVDAISKDGKEFTVELSVSALKIRDKWHAVAIVRDISERKKMEKELKEKIEELERFYKLAVDRELKMIELKKEIDKLRKKCGEKPKYRLGQEVWGDK